MEFIDEFTIISSFNFKVKCQDSQITIVNILSHYMHFQVISFIIKLVLSWWVEVVLDNIIHMELWIWILKCHSSISIFQVNLYCAF